MSAAFASAIPDPAVVYTDPDYLGSSSVSSASLTVNPASQLITFDALSTQVLGTAPITMSATGGGSGNPVTFTASPGSVCVSSGANGASITLVGVGTCMVTASQESGANYLAAAVSQSFAVVYPPLYLVMTLATSPPGIVTTGSTVTQSFVLGNHTLSTQTVTGQIKLTYTGSRGTLSITIPLALRLKAGQTISQSESFPITKSFPKGTYQLSLTVKDGAGDTAASSATLTVS